MRTYTIYKAKDESEARYENAPVISEHRSLTEAVKVLAKNDGHMLIRDTDAAEFVIAARKYAHRYGHWMSDEGTIEYNAQF